jgi:adenylate cyclase
LTNTFKRILVKIRRRQVLPVLITYLALSWILIQAAAIVLPALLMPEWTVRLVVILTILGLPVIVILAWFFNITPKGIQKTSELDVQSQSTKLQSSKSTALLPPVEGAIAAVTVLPFESLGSDANKGILADGLATEIHSTLGQMHQVRVASRRAAFRYRDSAQPIQEIAQELGVRYIVSGNLMCSGDQVRVIAELDDALTGTQLWSQKFSRTLDDLFAIQAEIAEAVVGAFGIERERADIARARKQPTASLDAWNLVQKARNYINDYSKASLDEAQSLLERGIELDADYACAHAALGSVLIEQVLNGYCVDKEAGRNAALNAVHSAQQLAPQDPFVLKMAGMVLAACGRPGAALGALRTCVKLAPFDFGAWGYFGWPLTARANPEDLDELNGIVERLLATAPEHPGAAYWLFHKSVSYSLQGELKTAAKLMSDAASRHQPVPWAYMHIANINGLLGKHDEAQNAVTQAKQLNPKMTPDHYAECIHAMTLNKKTASKRLEGLVTSCLLNNT